MKKRLLVLGMLVLLVVSICSNVFAYYDCPICGAATQDSCSGVFWKIENARCSYCSYNGEIPIMHVYYDWVECMAYPEHWAIYDGGHDHFCERCGCQWCQY